MVNKINLDFINELINVNPDYEMKEYIDEFYQKGFPDALNQFIEKGRAEGHIHKESYIPSQHANSRRYIM